MDCLTKPQPKQSLTSFNTKNCGFICPDLTYLITHVEWKRRQFHLGVSKHWEKNINILSPYCPGKSTDGLLSSRKTSSNNYCPECCSLKQSVTYYWAPLILFSGLWMPQKKLNPLLLNLGESSTPWHKATATTGVYCNLGKPYKFTATPIT